MSIVETTLKLVRDKVVKQNRGHDWLSEYVCSCGNKTLATKHNVNSGKVRSCGCYKSQYIASKNKTHGLIKLNLRLYRIWKSMKRRCNNKNDHNYHNYGGRGIKVCEEWLKYPEFYNWSIKNGYESHLTIERIDVNGNYEPNNCKWIINSEQARNTRISVGWEKVNYIRTCNKTTKQLVEELNFSKSTINRIKRGDSYITPK